MVRAIRMIRFADPGVIRFADPHPIRFGDPIRNQYAGPLHKEQNADGRRRVIEPATPMAPPPPSTGIAPHLRQLMAEYAATGLPPAYLPLATTSAAPIELDAELDDQTDADGDLDHAADLAPINDLDLSCR